LLLSKVTIRNGGFPCAFYQTTSPSFEPLIEYVQRLCQRVQSKWDWSAYFKETFILRLRYDVKKEETSLPLFLLSLKIEITIYREELFS
jgi:hypothetical protein